MNDVIDEQDPLSVWAHVRDLRGCGPPNTISVCEMEAIVATKTT
jgi:hypothetical protein